METIKIVNLLNDLNDKASKFATKKWSVTDSETKGDYSHENPTKFLTSSLESSLCNYSEAYISVTGGIAVTRTITAAVDNPIQRNQTINAATQVAFKNCAPFKNYNTEINDTFVDEAGFINVAVPMYSLIEYSDNHPDTSGSLWSFKRDKIASNANVTIDTDTSSFKYKASIIGDTAADVKIDGVKIAVPLKCFSDFWRSLGMLLINCKVELFLTWVDNYVLTTAAIGANANATGKVSATLKITDTKLYVPVVTLSIENNEKLEKNN